MIPCSTALFSRCHALKVPRSWPAKQRCAGHRLARMGQLASLSSAAELKLWSLKSPGPKTSPRCDHQPWPWQISSSWTPFHYMVLVEECCTQTSPCKKAAGSRRQPGPCYVCLAQVSASVLGAKVLSCATLLSERHLVTAGQELRKSQREFTDPC